MTPEELQLARDRAQDRIQRRVIDAQEGDSKKAAQAVQLEQDTGVDAQTIYSNHEAFTNDYSKYLTQRMLDRNPGLAAYINSHPMAAVVSKNDWDRMADFQDRLDALSPWVKPAFMPEKAAYEFGAAAQRFGEGFREGFDKSAFGKWISPNVWQKAPVSAWLNLAGSIAVEGPLRIMGATIHGAEAAVPGLGAGLEWLTTDPTILGMFPAAMPAVAVLRLARAAKVSGAEAKVALELEKAQPYLKNGVMPPTGVHPVWDAYHAERVKNGMSVYDALVDAANSTETKALSPEMLKRAIELKTKEDISLQWDAVRNLYGDKLPEPGDGILGDIPGFAKQYKDALEVPSDIRIPISEWIAKAPDEVVKALHDDIKLRSEDPTLRETQAFPTIEQAEAELTKPEPPKPVVPPEELAVRTERLREEFGERQLTHGEVEKVPGEEGNLLHSLRAVSGYEFDANNLSQGVRWAYLNNRMDIVDQGLALAHGVDPAVHARLEAELNNIKRNQLAIEAANREVASKPLGWAEAEVGPEYPTVRELLASPEWKPIGEMTLAKAPGELSEIEALTRKLVATIFENLGGPGAGVKLVVARELRMGLERPTPVSGAYVMPSRQSLFKDPTIAFILGSEDPVRTIGHEMIHHLRRYRFLTDEEWLQLERAAKREGWIDKHNILERYEGRPEDILIEESVANEFGEWLSKGLDERVAHPANPIFQRIADFLHRIRVALKELFGRDLTVEEIFKEIESRRVAEREPTGPPMYGGKPLAEVPPIEVPPIEKEGLLGILPKGREERYLRLINRQNRSDVEKLLGDALKEERKRQTPEWNLNYAREKAAALDNLQNRPDFRVSAFFRNGIVGDQKLDGLPKLDPRFLTPEDKAMLPKAWFRQRDGLAPDDIASLFGFKNGREMLNAMIRFEERKGTDKPGTFLNRMASQEAERRMQLQYGDLDENILQEAREHAVGMERFDLMHEETLMLADKLGQKFPFSKQDIKNQAALKFNDSISSQVPLIKYVRDLGKANRAAEDAWLKGDATAAYVLRQQSLRLQALAEHAKKFEREKVTFDKVLKRFSKREVDGLPPEYTNWIHHIMFRIDKAPKRHPADLAREIGAQPKGEQSLEGFLKSRSTEGWLPEGYQELEVEYVPQIPVWQELIDNPEWKKGLDATTVGEYRALRASINALVKAGRDELTTYLEGQALNRAAVLDKMVDAFKQTGIDKLPTVGDKSTWEKAKYGGERMMTSLIQMDYLWTRLDQTPYGGLFYKHFGKPFMMAGNEYRSLIAEFGSKYQQLKRDTTRGVDMKTPVPNNVLMEPLYGMPEEVAGKMQGTPLGNGQISRSAFRVVMLNAGNESNLGKLAKGYHTEPEEIRAWINQHATKEDWDYVRGVWKLFEEIQNKDDIVARNLHGVALERLPLGKIPTNFGEIDGGYFPMIYDRSRGGGAKAGKIDPDLPPTIMVLTDRGFERKRTQYAGPVSLAMSPIEGQFTRRIRSLAFREVLTESQRFFGNKRFTDAMTRHLGEAYTALLTPYLRDLAGIRGPVPAGLQALERAFDYITQTFTVHAVGWNPGTIGKHNLTAAINQMGDVKNKMSLLVALRDLYINVPSVMKENHEFILKNSQEIKGRRPHWNEALGGHTDEITGEQTLRSKMTSILSWPIATVDQMLSKVLWLAKYREMMDEYGPTMKFEEAHGEASVVANQTVVRTHGSTAITSRPQAMRIPLLKPFTALYGFFNHFFNRAWELRWQYAKFGRELKAGEATLADFRFLAARTFYLAVPAAIFEELFTPMFDKEDRSLVGRFALSLGFPFFSMVPLVREMFHAMVSGHDPSFGTISSAGKTYTDLMRQIKKAPDVDVGNTIQALISAFGVTTGLTSQEQARFSKFMYNYFMDIDRPQEWDEWGRALRYGTSKERRH